MFRRKNTIVQHPASSLLNVTTATQYENRASAEDNHTTVASINEGYVHMYMKLSPALVLMLL